MVADLNLPATLISAVQEQRAVMFLGAGASIGAGHPRKLAIPLGDKLRDEISDKFLGGELKSRPLTAVAAMAASEVGLIAFQKYIRDIFLDFEPADFHLLVPTFRWRAIVTTNFDLIVEKAYQRSRAAVQTLVPSWKDGDLFDNRVQETSDPVGYYKLHGCIDHYTDDSIPLILGQEQYASYATNRIRFYSRLKDLAYDNPVIFCGYSISDPHIQQFLFDLTDKSIKRPQYYYVSPGLTDIETRYWASNHVVCIPATFAQLLESLDKKISTTARRLKRGTSTQQSTLFTFYRSATAIESDELRFYVENDVAHLHSGLVPPRQEPQEFYKGYDTGFGCILQNLDIRRPVTDSVLVDTILLDDAHRKFGEFYLLKGPGGNGKTVALKRVAWEAAVAYDKLALYLEGAAGLRFEPLNELHELTGRRIFLFVDRVALVREELERLLATCRAQRFPLTVVGAERENEWHIYCEGLVRFMSQEFSIGYLSKDEIVDLLAALERHRALGLLTDKTPAERINAFMVHAERQLLVALHVTTLGVPFETIVFDEYNRIRPREAQQLYLQICALHQFGAPVRAGLVSRTSGVSFHEIGEQFLRPLADVVLVESSRHAAGDVFYRSRHQHVSELVFNQALPTEEDRFNLLASLMQSINIDYRSDDETFSRMVRGRDVAKMFSNIELGRLLYDRAEKVAKGEWFVPHQRAVFELHHAQGALGLAETAASRAVQINPTSRSVRHTQAEIARRQALTVSDPLLKQSYRRVARERISQDGVRLSEYDLHTRAKVAIDELRELIAKTSKETPDGLLLTATKEAETAVIRGRAEFPDSTELLAAESDLRDLLNQAPLALAALERAFKLNPRQDWLAIRLGKRYAQGGDTKRAIEALQQCLRLNPDSKSAHLYLARLLQDTGGDQTAIIGHLRGSFTTGDNNFEGQFWYGRELFIAARLPDSERIFEALSERAPGSFRTNADAPILRADRSIKSFEGTVARKEEGYGFIRIVDLGTDVFASRADSARFDWDRLQRHSLVSCYVAFSRRGPRATRITIRQK